MLRPYAAASSPLPLLRHAAPPVASRRRQSGTSIRPAVYRAERHAVDERTTLRFLRLDDSPLMRSAGDVGHVPGLRSEEHTSELQSRFDLVCRLLLEK